MGLLRTSTATPVLTPEQARAHLRIDDPGEDALLADLISVATDHVERETGTTLTQADYTMTLDRWPSGGAICLPASPLLRVDSIRYRDQDNVDRLLPTANYAADEFARPARIVLFDRPLLGTHPAALRIDFVAGYDDPAGIPPTLIHAVKLLVGHLYENREASSDRRVNDVPFGVAALLLKHTYIEAV